MRRRWLFVGAGALGLVVVAALAAWWFLLRGDAPPEVDLATANVQLDEDLAVSSSSTTTLKPFDGDINGRWVVNADIGSFDFETASGSFAGFRVEETFGEGVVQELTAVGRSGGIAGELEIVDETLVATEIVVDMTGIVSNDSRRESSIRSAVKASEFPTATFTLTEPIALPVAMADGTQVSVDAVGTLTIAGMTNTVTVTIDALIRDDGLGVVVGSTEIVFADYGVERPTSRYVFSLDEHGIVEFQLIIHKS